MSYFMADGTEVAQAAAGLGNVLLPPQAAAGLGQNGPPTRAVWDGIFGDQIGPGSQYGKQTRSWKDGIFGPALGQAETEMTISLEDPDVLKETKMMLGYLQVADLRDVLDSGVWGPTTETAFKAWAETTPDAASLVQMVDGHAVPNAPGLFHLWNAARQAAEAEGRAGYPSTYWPRVTAWATSLQGPGGAVLPPKFGNAAEEEGGILRGSTVAWVAGGAALAFVGYLVLRPGRRRG